MNPKKQPVRVVQYFNLKKLNEFKHLTPHEILCWLDEANELLYQTYLSSGNKEPYDPKSWTYL